MRLITESTLNTAGRGATLKALLGLLGHNTITEFQRANGLAVDGVFGIMSWNRLYTKLLKVEHYPMRNTSFFQQTYPKTQIVLHHAASRDSARGMFQYFESITDRVAVSIGIEDSGKVVKAFDESFWGWHSGLGWAVDTRTIAVEIMSWGALRLRNGQFYAWPNDYGTRGAGVIIPRDRVYDFGTTPYKGERYFEIYTANEITATMGWLLLLNLRFEIPLTYRDQDLWRFSQNAMSGISGVYTHNSYDNGRLGKTDICPQKPMVDALQNPLKHFVDNFKILHC